MIKYDGQAIQVLRTSHLAILKWQVVYVERSMKIYLEEGEHNRLSRESLLGYLKTIATSFPVWP